MKTAALPAVLVEPDFLHALQSVLTEGETVAAFVEASVRQRPAAAVRAEFIARGLRSRDELHRSGDYVDADTVCDGLQRKLDGARAWLAGSQK